NTRYQPFVRVQPPPSPKEGPILAVGRRALVTCNGASDRDRVTLTDEEGTSAIATLDDGIEVEILAWRPRRGGRTRYRVIATKGGIEGWLGAANLRAIPIPVLPKPVAPTAAAPRPSAPAGRPGRDARGARTPAPSGQAVPSKKANSEKR